MESKSIIHLILTVAPSVFIIFVLFQVLLSDVGIIHRKSIQIKYENLQEEIGQIEKKNLQLRLKIEYLKQEHKIPHIAAERLLMGSDSTTVYRFSGN